MSGPKEITLSGVSKIFNEAKPNATTALTGINLTLTGGAVTVFRGPSGSGKTTLLTLIGCLARPTTGRVHIDAEMVSSLPESFLAALRRNTFGFVFQSFNLIRGLSVLDNVMLPGYPLAPGHRQLKANAMDRLERLDLGPKAGEPIEHLSGGEAQRAAIARALINDPPIIIADEPTANLDTALTERFLEIIDSLKTEGRTVLITSHDPRIWKAGIVDEVITMRDGAISGDFV